MINGFININKQENLTSSNVVVSVRGILRQYLQTKNFKIGHLGTLDPLATGVLPIAVGKATKLFDYMLNKKKCYIANFKFNETSETLDRGSDIIQACNKVEINEQNIEKALLGFRGKINQIPPLFSAKNVDGRRAYDLARQGIQFTLNSKQVEIFNFELLRKIKEDEFEFMIECSAGTYIRSLARDLANKLSTVGYMSTLNRIKCGNFILKDSVLLDNFRNNPLQNILPLEYALSNLNELFLNEIYLSKILNGVSINSESCLLNYEKSLYVDDFLLKCNNQILGIATNNNGNLYLKVRLYES